MRRVALVAALASLGADCGRPELACVDFSGRTVELTIANPEPCLAYPAARVCSNLTLPERLVVRILDEPVQRRELQCEVYRAEIVEGDFGDLELLGPTDGTLVVSGDFAVAELVRVGATDCYGRFFVSAARIGPLDRSDAEYWLTPDTDVDSETGKWAFAYEFIPTDPAACEGVQTACNNSHCFADARSVD